MNLTTNSLEIRPAAFSIARMPLFSSDEFYKYAKTGDGGELLSEHEYRRIFFQQRKMIIDDTSNPVVREAIFSASRSLYERIVSLSADNSLDSSKKTYRAAFKYLARMSSRSTPFGLFAGIAWSCHDTEIESEPAFGIQRGELSTIRRYTRID